MLSASALRALHMVFRISSGFKSIPFKWNQTKKAFETSRNHRILFLVNVFLDFSYRSVTTCIALHMVFNNRSDVSKLVLIFVYFFASVIFAGSVTLSLILYENETLLFLNTYLKMDADMSKR